MGASERNASYNAWIAGLTWSELESRFRSLGVEKVVMKRLAERQDNSKNQIYWQGNLNENPLPKGNFVAFKSSSKRRTGPGYKAKLDFEWLTPTGASPAPKAQLIHYPQYPETRLGSLISGATYAPRSVVGARAAAGPGRLLLLAIAGEKIIGVALPPQAPAATALGALFGSSPFATWTISRQAEAIGPVELLAELRGVYDLSPVPACRITRNTVVKYIKTNSPGTTLETALGVKPNSRDEPDFHGWELKAHGDSRITLMTPAPTGGAIVTESPEDFMRMFGWKDAKKKRWDFNGAHRSTRAPGGKATTEMDLTADEVRLVHKRSGAVAMSWQIADLLTHWTRKHLRAAYVRHGGSRANGFTFGPYIQLAEGIDWNWFRQALTNGTVVVDPAYNMKVGANSMERARAQFRCFSYELGALYPSVSAHDLRHHRPSRRLALANLRDAGITLPSWI